jgi:hypothetical protein
LCRAGCVAAAAHALSDTNSASAADVVNAAPPRSSSLLPLLVGVTLAGLGLFTLIGALAPPAGLEWDALSYQLAVPKIWLRAGRIFYLPWVSHSNFPFTLQMLYTLMLGVGSVSAAKLCHWLCGALLVASVYTFGARHLAQPLGAERARTAGLVAALILATTPSCCGKRRSPTWIWPPPCSPGCRCTRCSTRRKE